MDQIDGASACRTDVVQSPGWIRLTCIDMLRLMPDLTHILTQIESCNSLAAEQLLPRVCQELRKLATRVLSNEPSGHTLQGPGNGCISPSGPESLWKVDEL